MRNIKLYSDGSFDPQTKRMHIGFFGEDGDTGRVLFCGHKDVRDRNGALLPGSCNEAELYAILETLEQAKVALGDNPGWCKTICYTDSMLAYNHIMGKWKIKSENLFVLVETIRQRLEEFGWQIVHIPREQNRMADSLSTEGVIGDGRTIVTDTLGDANGGIPETPMPERGISSGMLYNLYDSKLPELRKKLMDAIYRRDSYEIISEADALAKEIKSATSVHITEYMDDLSANIRERVCEDMGKIQEYGKAKNFEAIEAIMETYLFRHKPNEVVDEAELKEAGSFNF